MVSLNKLLVSLEGCGLIKQIAGFIGPHLVLLDRLLATLDKLLAALTELALVKCTVVQYEAHP